jgi:hypothetical protein
MFESLDSVPWSELDASCGQSIRIPSLLKAILASDSHEYENIAAVIEGVLTGQGELYEASPYAVPFLLELLDARHPAAQYMYSVLWEVGNIRAVAPEASQFRLPSWTVQERTLKEACREVVRSGIDIYLRDAESAELPCRRGAFELLAEFLVDDARVRERLPELARQEASDELRREALGLLDEYDVPPNSPNDRPNDPDRPNDQPNDPDQG